MASTSDAVRSGLVASLARPRANITGLTSMGGETQGKRLELLKEIIPKLSRAGFVTDRQAEFLEEESLREDFEERAAILEYDAGLSRDDAEHAAKMVLSMRNGTR